MDVVEKNGSDIGIQQEKSYQNNEPTFLYFNKFKKM